ncbi:MAG: transglutaminase, partial [Cyanobacteria bacterium J06649_11]
MTSVLPAFTVSQMIGQRTIRPFAVASLYGIAFKKDILIAVDPRLGHLLQIDPKNDNTRIINSHQTKEFMDVRGLALWEDTLWITRENSVYSCKLDSLGLVHFATLPYPADGVAVWGSTVYVSCEKLGKILVYNRNTGKEIARFFAPGVGVENLTVTEETLLVSDTIEQSVYFLDRATGEIQFSVLTPFESPTGIALHTDSSTKQQSLYVAYSSEEPYIRDNPNAEPNHELTYRDRAFIHPLNYHFNREKRTAVSNGYLLEMSYVEQIDPLEEVYLKDLEWRIALPSETERQKVKQVEPVGLPFTEEIIDGQRVAVFKFDTLVPGERHLLGWKAIVEVRSIKYRITPRDVENPSVLPKEFTSRYLVDDDDLAMESNVVRAAAIEAVGN